MFDDRAGKVLVEQLSDWGVDHIYGMHGDSINNLMEELRKAEDKIKFIQVRHEEAGALAASSYAKLTGKLGVCLSIAGPGAIHLLNGLYDAKKDHAPVLVLAGQVPTDQIGTDGFQEVNMERIFDDVAVFNKQVVSEEQLPSMVNQAIRTAYAKKGVAVLTLPDDISAEKIKNKVHYSIRTCEEVKKMTKRPIVFFDLDGTLLTSEKKVAESSIKAIEKLIENNGIPVLATGRPVFETKELQAETGIQSAVLMNGQFIVHEGEVIYRNRINPVQLKKLEEYTEQRGVTICYHTAERIYTTNDQSELLKKDCEYCDREIPVVDDDIYMNKPVYQVEIFIEEGEEEYQEKFPELQFVRNSPYNCDVFPKGISKATGIKEFLEITGLPKENTYAFGDGLNDLEMFQFVKTSVAMENSVEEIKEAATYITKSHDDDGIADGMKMCGLIGQEESEK